MINLENLPKKEFLAGFVGQFIHTENASIGFWEIKKGATLPSHSHLHEQTTMVTSGQFELTVGSQKMVYKAGMIAVIPPHVPHSGVALTNCTITDIFCPVREDYKF